ncbi:2-amino-4-hydroxy-6-hydroxymethyldihydropteridine diphosphokinase [Frigidibacter sp. MR17.24]|uniref:2-amino-4-hydroxy-6- hydroxymethyldihydropteridine diphosphokinase n=1 Tax=Frigidibacter sp. MR17.24 TaxID=3127345 RepID=UPI003012AE51
MSQDAMREDDGGFAPIALGANLDGPAGDPAQSLRAALRLLSDRGMLRAVSRFWRTPAVPAGSGPDFVNAAALVTMKGRPSAAAAAALLAELHAIEARLGRVRHARWAARAVDLDLLGWGDLVLPDAATQAHWRSLPPESQRTETPSQLILPHPRLAERGFVLAPLAEIASGWRDPVSGRTVAEMLAALPPAALAGMAPLAAAAG